MTRGSWIRLDNAAKIYPAARHRGWSALFRLSVCFTEPVDPDVLQIALLSTLKRCVSFACRLRRGMFWYYLELTPDLMPKVQPDVGNPCVPFSPKDNGGFSFRVRYHENRMAVEFFHVLTDGAGGLVFVKTLAAEYLRIKYGAEIPRNSAILDCEQPFVKEELEDGFLKNAGKATLSRAEKNSYRIRGENEPVERVHITTGILNMREVAECASQLNVSVTEYLTAVLILSIDAIQRRYTPKASSLEPIKITVPVNLRTLFPSDTLRNFASYVNPGIDPRLGDYTLEEVAGLVHSFMHTEVNTKMLSAKFTTNVRTEQNKLLRVAPLFLKDIVMRQVFLAVGDKKSSTCFSNLGRVDLPEEMANYVTRMDFILGPLSVNRVAVAALGYNGKLYFNFTRTIREPEVEREFFTRLVKLGIHVKLESNSEVL